MKNKFKCPKCSSFNTVWRGYRHNKSGKKHLRKCNDCDRSFTPDDGFLRMRFKKEHIVEAVSLRVNGLSISQVVNHMWQHHGIKIDEKTVRDWVKKYSKLIRKFTDKLKPKINGNIHSDEVIVKVKKKKAYYWGSKDRKTKFKIAGVLTEKREYENGAKKLFQKIEDKCYDEINRRKEEGEPVKFISDKLGHYKKAFNKFFLHVAELVHGVPIACKKYGLEHNNNCMERDNERIKQRYKTMRGFKDFDDAEDMLNLMDDCYNFVNPHMFLNGRTPAEEAGLDLKLGRNKLLHLIFF